MPDTKPLVLSVSFGEKGTVYGCGHALDTFCYALKLTTEEQMFENNIDFESGWLSDTFNTFDFAGALRDELNELTPVEASNRIGQADLSDDILESDYLPGDYLSLECPDTFETLLEAYREEARAAFYALEYGSLPKALQDELEETRDACQRELHRLWLHGDRHDAGVLELIAKHLFDDTRDATVAWDQTEDVVTITLNDPEALRSLYGYDLSDDDKLPTAEEASAYLKDYILNRADGVYTAAKIAQEGRKAERDRLIAYKAEQAQAERARLIQQARDRKKAKVSAK